MHKFQMTIPFHFIEHEVNLTAVKTIRKSSFNVFLRVLLLSNAGGTY